jgi:hypothetical protein
MATDCLEFKAITLPAMQYVNRGRYQPRYPMYVLSAASTSWYRRGETKRIPPNERVVEIACATENRLASKIHLRFGS